ncbi:unnamed protein product [Colias eurytheme]|nr:unnamed protein product [Colias eurytheme]
MNCAACKKLLRHDEKLDCITCSGSYHYKCINISAEYFKKNIKELKRSWLCPLCKNVTSRRKGDETPAKAQLESTSHETSSSSNSSPVIPPSPLNLEVSILTKHYFLA